NYKLFTELKSLNLEEVLKLADGIRLYQNYYGYSEIDINKIKTASNRSYHSLSKRLDFDGESTVQVDVKLTIC
ncbi:MAG TPA: hypothetical protein VJZ06_07695, partial [Mobilitalea sp.]|nr:hypothetical protein [Mobilitalea sp.]